MDVEMCLKSDRCERDSCTGDWHRGFGSRVKKTTTANVGRGGRREESIAEWTLARVVPLRIEGLDELSVLAVPDPDDPVLATGHHERLVAT